MKENHPNAQDRDIVADTERIIQNCHAAWDRFQKARVSTQRVLDGLARRPHREARAWRTDRDAPPSA